MKALYSLSLALLLCFLLASLSSAASEPSASSPSLVGTWGCQSVYGGPFTGRACPTWPQLSLHEDGTYAWGSEKGTWEVNAQQLHLSGRTGTGHLDENGKLIVEYEVKGTQYRQTLFRR
ncbi:MAG: hypothetical protein ACKOCD_09750 [Nitrospiraceae bacterium]